MNVLVTGGDGFVGRHLCRELDERGHDVAALSRDPDPTALPDGVETVAGDVTDRSSIDPALEGVDVLVNLVALSPLFIPTGGNEMHERIHLGGTENLVAAAEDEGVERFVQMSALGADPDGSTHYIRAKGRAEEVVRESALEWVIVRPSVIFGDGGEFVGFTKKLTPPVVAPLPGGGKTRFQPIWVEDLAPMLADCVEDDDRAGEVYELGGPEQLTLKQIAKLVRGRVAVVPVPMALAGVGLSIGGAVPGFPMGSDQYRSLRFDNTTAENDVTAFGTEPDVLLTLEEYLHGI
ncbi:NADH dehydrogenase-oxidoreductase-like protein [Halorhabdus tiamatea SARL4B]|uniref:NAD-dependent epimerase/dehydratase n=1 Tax=Halorhabdus tiamatea SARL4B TaxID=1033806 RepID=F7PIV5_9EURY|nr:complex I NDUFA9 subunit family protein [Halorhabdus tiamatea]ERJ05446.1 NADH dehydrogenase-oxidoreductase-like protein [Halorhabdus tiamatea SARL4B]CCQ33328.1 NAD-dependent epimerase/dehydratase [Halorhabdus tiamatea SARL4B]